VLRLVVLARPRLTGIGGLVFPAQGSSRAIAPRLDSLPRPLKWGRRGGGGAASSDSGSVGIAALLSVLPWDSKEGNRCKGSVAGRQFSISREETLAVSRV